MSEPGLLGSETILVAVIAAAAALLGTVAGQFGPLLQHWLSTRQERRSVLRERYEQMAGLSSELLIHLNRRVDALMRKSTPPTPTDLVQAASQMHVLALLYFPELLPEIEALRTAALRLDASLIGDKSSSASDDAQAFSAARKAAVEAIRKYAERYARR